MWGTAIGVKETVEELYLEQAEFVRAAAGALCKH